MDFDILVIGAGPAGLALSTYAANMGLKVAMFDRQSKKSLASPKNDGRDIAVAAKSKKILNTLGAWDKIPQEEISPIKSAKVVDGDSPFSLNFDPNSTGSDCLGNIISNHLIRKALYDVAKTKTNITLYANSEVASLVRTHQKAIVTLKDGSAYTAPLAIAADTRFSQIRRDAGIKANMHDFGHTMIVGRMHVSIPHNHIAHECFRYDGGLAVLPLNNNIASIVQTFPAEDAARYMAMDDKEYASATGLRLKGLLGDLKCASERVSYPLVGVYAQSFHTDRLALIGDAAVGMHPVTAHGFNFGIQGVANLAKHLRKAQLRDADLGASSALRAYSRDHRRLTWPLYQVTEKMMTLYTANTIPARLARKTALHAAQTLTPVKDILMNSLADQPLHQLIKSKLPPRPRFLPRL